MVRNIVLLAELPPTMRLGKREWSRGSVACVYIYRCIDVFLYGSLGCCLSPFWLSSCFRKRV